MPIVIKDCQDTLNRELNCIRYEQPSVYKCNIKTSLLKYRLKWSFKFFLLGALISSKRVRLYIPSINYPHFANIFNFFVVKFKLFRKSSDVLLLGVTNITFVLRFKKSNKFYYVKTDKVVNSKGASC